MSNFVDLVIAGPDFSGTTTQIDDIIKYFRSVNASVKDLRGTENDVLFHAELFSDERKRLGEGEFLNLNEYQATIQRWRETGVTTRDNASFFYHINELLGGGGTSRDLRVGSMVKNDITTYINPNSADVWIMEEPTRRGAGQVCRVIEQNRSKFGSQLDGYSAALAHQAYRTEEFLRFRKPLRDAGKLIVRSRSEESACYQVYDEKSLHSGITIDDYLKLPGHKVAFANPPSHIFVVCGPKDWKQKDYLELKSERTGNRILDDHESNYSYQLLVNQRYASDWIENLYKKGCGMYGSKEPMIVKFDIYNSKEQTKELMNQAVQAAVLRNFLENVFKKNN
jgi:hypothetical protein